MPEHDTPDFFSTILADVSREAGKKAAEQLARGFAAGVKIDEFELRRLIDSIILARVRAIAEPIITAALEERREEIGAALRDAIGKVAPVVEATIIRGVSERLNGRGGSDDLVRVLFGVHR